MARAAEAKGKLRIGDDWNAIRIIALSQSNPLKAIAELVENSIDAHARKITITRGREHGEHYLAIRDDGDGVPRDANGIPDFRYVATHICDSVKRRLKSQGTGAGIQGEFGIGLLSFWTVGERLVMTSTGSDQRAYQMTMNKGDPSYEMSPRRVLFAERGTEVRISPLLEGIRTLSGEKIQWYLASELRDRIRSSGVRVSVIDKLARKQLEVEPRQFDGRLLHQLPSVRTSYGDAYVELYVTEPAESSRVALYRSGTRVVEVLGSLPGLEHAPWTSSYLEGLIDVPFLNVTPGTRSGIIHDERYAALCEALRPLEEHSECADCRAATRGGGAGEPAAHARHSARLSRGTAGPAAGGVRLVRRARALRSAGRGASFGRERQSARGFAGGSSAGRGRTGARGRATAPVLRARRIALQCRCLARGEHDCRERLPLFQSAAARSVQTPSDRRPAIPLGNHRRWGHPRE